MDSPLSEVKDGQDGRRGKRGKGRRGGEKEHSRRDEEYGADEYDGSDRQKILSHANSLAENALCYLQREKIVI